MNANEMTSFGYPRQLFGTSVILLVPDHDEIFNYGYKPPEEAASTNLSHMVINHELF